MRMFGFVMFLSVLVQFVAAPQPLAAAQPAADPLAAIRDKETLTEEDRQAVREYVTQRIAAVTGSDAVGAARAGTELREPARGSARFQETFAQATLEAVRAALPNASPVAAAQMLAILNALNDPSAGPLFLEALRDTRDDRVGVRAAAVIGLRNLRPKLGRPGGPSINEVLTALREAGKREGSAVTLRNIYHAMNYVGVTGVDASAVATALLDLLETRSQAYASGEIRGVGADAEGFRVAEGLRTSLSEADRNRLTVIAARMLKYAVERYTLELYQVKDASPTAPERDAVEELIDVIEASLRSLLSPNPAPNIGEQMRKGGDARVQMKIEMNKWAELIEKATGQRFFLDEADDGSAR